MKLSVVIPAHNEVDSIEETVRSTAGELDRAQIDYEILVIDDASGDGTGDVVRTIADANPRVRCERSHMPPGFGHAVRAGLERYTGDAVAIMMADLSDSPRDLVLYYHVLQQGYDCAFGTRFGHGGEVHDYPRVKLVLNRIVNFWIRVLFHHGYNDTTNAFKAYRRYVIDQLQPLLSNHFNLTVELPLKAVVRGFNYAVVPVGWRNRTHGSSKLNLPEMGSRYLFIVLYVWLEHHLSRGDYRRKDVPSATYSTDSDPAISDSSGAERSRSDEINATPDGHSIATSGSLKLKPPSLSGS
jgi:dolichol-phosphate mannosyltransferase